MNSKKAIWMAFLNNFDFEVRHIKGKENKVTDALSRRTHEVYKVIMIQPKSDLMDKVKTTSTHDDKYTKLCSQIKSNEVKLKGIDFKVDLKGLLWFKDRMYMLKNLEIKIFILNEMHKIPFAGHPSYQKMITDMRKKIFCPGLNFDLVEYLSNSLECQQVKT